MEKKGLLIFCVPGRHSFVSKKSSKGFEQFKFGIPHIKFGRITNPLQKNPHCNPVKRQQIKNMLYLALLKNQVLQFQILKNGIKTLKLKA
jgi:hypothetical protein